MKIWGGRVTGIIFAGLTGFLIGTAIPSLFHMGTGSYAGLFSLYSLGKYESMQIRPERLLAYILAARLPMLLFLWMSSYTAAGILFHIGYVWWLAASAGMLLSLFVLRDGYGGIVLFGCCLLPQWILYVSMWKRELAFFLGKAAGGGVNREGIIPIRRAELRGLGRMVLLCMAGCAAEAFLGMWTLKIYLHFFT